MPSGSVQFVVVCVPKSPQSGASIAPCSTSSTGVRYVPTQTQAFVVDKSMEPVLTQLQNMNNGSVKYAEAGAWYAAAWLLTMVVWWAAKPLGVFLSFVKKG